MSNDIVIVRGVRYRAEDARRLGLTATDGKVVTRNSRQVPRTTDAPAGLITTKGANATGEKSTGDESTGANAQGDGAQGDNSTSGAVDRPAGNATKADWIGYALANGRTAEDLEGLKRDDIAALFTTDAEADDE